MEKPQLRPSELHSRSQTSQNALQQERCYCYGEVAKEEARSGLGRREVMLAPDRDSSRRMQVPEELLRKDFKKHSEQTIFY